MENPKKDCLAIYKGQPVIVTETGKKIDIKLTSGESKKVRDKDILVIHSGPTKSLNFSDLKCDIQEIWTLLEGEEITLSELSEYLFEEDSVEATYNAYKILQEQRYFIGEIDSITCNTQDVIDAELLKQKLKLSKALEFDESISRLSKGNWIPEDEAALREIESLALEQRTNSKILKTLKVKETPIDAHRFLLRLNYWSLDKNPHPGRMAVSLKSTVKNDDYLESTNPVDLTHLESYAIDDQGSRDPDDAISLDGDKLWIHITDVASLVKPHSNGDADASAKGSNLYLPSQTVHMLPPEVTDIQALGLNDGNNTLSFMVQFDSDFNIVERDVLLTRVKVTRLTYQEVEDSKDSSKFEPFYKISEKLKKRREAAGAISIELPEVKIRVDKSGEISIKPIHGVNSRNVVSEFMLLAGETAAIFCSENNISIPYASQQAPDAKGFPEPDLASMFTWRRKFKRGETKFSPSPHSGLGFELYTRATSPLRRYSDLVVNQQIRAFLLGEDTLEEEDLLLRVAPAVESSRKLSLCERASNLHWKLVYLDRNKDVVFQGTYVEKKDKNNGMFIIQDLALECLVQVPKELELNDNVNLKVKKIDIPAGLVTFITC
ncbi:MAG: RNB domain-containing ribonuclease [Spirochaetaceae bacterium]